MARQVKQRPEEVAGRASAAPSARVDDDVVVARETREDPNTPRMETDIPKSLAPPQVEPQADEYEVVSAPEQILYNGQLVQFRPGMRLPSSAHGIARLRASGVVLKAVTPG
jgi:hypothetical protein